ncbi:YbaB/EbfC family nucleoid-associated protein [Amycolatopsis sp. H20-H5]|uniref:YbaB/EbfC family nucleoid-associated protein n=1 Tax=Amycolatopsis sp. H20-H5 TaxID=3046309 RepID=UPI002DBAA38B|nr:YbaB/EbfC family nucleoid-associated protein [Amycolatopsis sp. H20-H5]MEC3978483.1 YbaB/EbfC family nucleoid-associated protein [Amycolatopsis sp. H20-H5]
MAEIDLDLEMSRLTEQVERTAREADERFARIGKVVGRAESGDGAIKVEVAPGGLLTGVTLSRAALRSGPDAIAAQIMELANRATRRAGERMYHALAPVLGENDPNLKSLGYEPIPEDDVDAEPIVGYQEG